jgi:glycosyltransferase involved in cell wall biosynthesis
MYFNVDFIKSRKKIGWIHNDYPFLKMNKHIDRIYFKKNDFVITVSQTCKNSLDNEFPDMREKFHIIENVNSAKLIIRMSTKILDHKFKVYKGLKILTIGRLVYQKGIDYAVNAALILKNLGLVFKWYIIGSGSEYNKLFRMVLKYRLSNDFIFLGNIKNPYPYLKHCDIYVQPSRYEGKSIALEEAKILKKPIIITKFPTALDQFNLKNALFSEINAEDLASKIYMLHNDSLLKVKLSDNLFYENDNILINISKLIKLFY